MRSAVYTMEIMEPERERTPRPEEDPKRAGPDLDPDTGLPMDPDAFFRAESRREQILQMQARMRRDRTTPIAVRFDPFTLRRLKAVAARRNKGYQTLLKEFVVERLYEEEKREGII
jgi:hypothetical protein